MKNLRLKKVCFMLALLVASSSISVTGNAATKSGTAKVWCGAPLIGTAYVYTPYTVTYNSSNNYVTSVKTKKSYKGAGITVFSYTHYKTWGDNYGKKKFNVYAQGVCDFIFKGCSISIGLQTFMQSLTF